MTPDPRSYSAKQGGSAACRPVSAGRSCGDIRPGIGKEGHIMQRPRVQHVLPLAFIVCAFVVVARSAAPADAVPGPPQPDATGASDSGAILVKYRPATT